jgi:hypothetical protein
MYRRQFVLSVAAACFPRAAPEEPQTFIYKKVGDCDIKADAFGAAGSGKHPSQCGSMAAH